MNLRLSRMLVKQQVDFQHYLFSQSEDAILCHIHNCMRCTRLEDCEAYLAAQRPSTTDDFRFCPNHASIKRLRKL